MRRIAAASLFGAFVTAAYAHDFWIEPSSFTPALGTPVKVHLRVGDEFPGDAVPRNDSRIEKFILVGADGETPIPGRDGGAPAGFIRIEKPGSYVLGYRNTPAFITLEAEKFEEYLRHEGLDEVIALRKARGQSGAEGKEIYSRCAKAIIQAGEADAKSASAAADRVLGFRLELIAERNPYALKAGDKFALRLLYEGKACANRLLTARSPSHPQSVVTGRTDADGRAELTLPEAGQWLVTAVHMIAAPADSGAEWESLWASLVFQLPDGSK